MNDRKLPPQAIEGEVSILGAIFLDNSCIRKVSGIIDAMDFYRESHRKIFRAMLHHQSKGIPIDLVTLSNTLKDRDELEEVGGASYLVQLVDYVPTSANVEYYCKMVKEASVRRQMILYGEKISEMAYESESVGEIIPEAKSGLSEITANMDSFGGVSLQDLSTFDSRMANYERRVKTIDQDRFITEYALLDRKIRGVAPGEVMTIVAEPGGFKTAFLQNLLKRGAKRTSKHALFFSMEMPDDKIFEREIQIDCGVSGWDVECHFKGGGRYAIDQKNIAAGHNGLIVCSKPRLSLEQMERYVDLTRQKFGEVVALGIDFIQLMPGPPGTSKIFDRIEHNAYGAKTMAKALNVPVILLSQINVLGRKEKQGINFSDAKGGGAIEEAADIGLGFYHDKSGVLVCEGLKNRNGPRGWKLEAEINRVTFQFIDFTLYEERKGKAKGEDDGCPY